MENNFDIFNLDNEAFVKQEAKGGREEDEFLYKPYPELGKDGVYKSLVRFLPNVANPKKSKVHQYYVWLKDPVDGTNMKALCPSTVGKKSILKDIFWKLKNSTSAKDQELAKSFSRKEDFYSLIQIVKDPNRPDLEGKIMVLKFGRKVNDLIEQQIKPEFGNPSNPYDLFDGKNFGLHVRKVGDWNNYDLCQFVGDKIPLLIDGSAVSKTEDDRERIVEYLKTGPQDLDKYDYKDWTEEENDKIMKIIRNTAPDGRLVSDIIAGVNSDTKQEKTSPSDSFFEEAKSSSSISSKPSDGFFEESSESSAPKSSGKKSSPSLDDLYNDL
jgi:hypothetical protein